MDFRNLVTSVFHLQLRWRDLTRGEGGRRNIGSGLTPNGPDAGPWHPECETALQ